MHLGTDEGQLNSHDELALREAHVLHAYSQIGFPPDAATFYLKMINGVPGLTPARAFEPVGVCPAGMFSGLRRPGRSCHRVARNCSGARSMSLESSELRDVGDC